jgi:hypothetical protein
MKERKKEMTSQLGGLLNAAPWCCAIAFSQLEILLQVI